MTSDIEEILKLFTAYSAILAAIFTIQVGFKNSQKANVLLGSSGRVFKAKKLELVELEKQDDVLIFPIDIINKGNGTIDKVYIDIEFETRVHFEVKAFTDQPKGGMIREYAPDLSCDDCRVAGWMNQTIWPETTIDLGKQNWIYINPDDEKTILLNWEVRTVDSVKSGKVQINIK